MFILTLVYLVLVILRPHEYPSYAQSPTALLQYVLLGALTLWLVGGPRNVDAPQYSLLLAFLCMGMLSVAVGGWVGGALEHATRFGPVIALFLILSNAVTTHARLRILIAVICTLSVVISIHGIDQHARGIGWTGVPTIQDGRIRYLGIFNDPNDLGMLLAIVLPLLVFLALRPSVLGLRKILWLTSAAVVLYAIYLTNSRGTLLAVATMGTAFVLLRRGTLTAIFVFAIALTVLSAIPSRLKGLDVGESSALGRIEAWYEGLQMFAHNPVFGVGANQFSELYHLTAHNSFVLALAETGIMGFIFWFAFIAYCFKMPLAIVRQPKEISEGLTLSDRRAATALFISLIGCITCAFFLSRTYVYVTYLIPALIVGSYIEARRRCPSLPSFSFAKDALGWVAISIAGVALFWIIVRILLSIV